jgi:hypothetical protein
MSVGIAADGGEGSAFDLDELLNSDDAEDDLMDGDPSDEEDEVPDEEEEEDPSEGEDPEDEDPADEDEDASEDPSDDEEDGDITGEGFAVDSNDTLTGTEGDDTFATEETETLTGIEINAGAGDDAIGLFVESITETSGEIFGEEGDDTITGNFFTGTLVDGGAGNDVIAAANAASNSTLLGGDGDDIITAGPATDGDLLIEGGAGDDTLSTTGDGTLLGGEGEDLIIVEAQRNSETEFDLVADGGADDDTIQLTGSAITELGIEMNTGITGGEGADTWRLFIDEGTPAEDVPIDESFLAADGSYDLEVLTLGDFTSGEDVIVVDAGLQDAAYTVSSANIETGVDEEDAPFSVLTVTYTSETLATRDVEIIVPGAVLTWDDVTFVGDNIPDELIGAEEAAAATL